MSVPNTVDSYQESINKKIRTAIPELNTVENHYGVFNVEEIFRRGNDSPAAYIAIPALRPGKVYSNGMISFMAEVTIVIITRHIGQEDAAVIGRRILTQVLLLASWNCFGSPVLPPTEIEGNELHYDKLDPMGLAMNVAAWSQEILISTEDPFFAKEQARMPDYSFPPLTKTILDGMVADIADRNPSDAGN